MDEEIKERLIRSTTEIDGVIEECARQADHEAGAARLARQGDVASDGTYMRAKQATAESIAHAIRALKGRRS